MPPSWCTCRDGARDAARVDRHVPTAPAGAGHARSSARASRRCRRDTSQVDRSGAHRPVDASSRCRVSSAHDTYSRARSRAFSTSSSVACRASAGAGRSTMPFRVSKRRRSVRVARASCDTASPKVRPRASANCFAAASTSSSIVSVVRMHQASRITHHRSTLLTRAARYFLSDFSDTGASPDSLSAP